MSTTRSKPDPAAELRRHAESYSAGTLDTVTYRALRRQLLEDFVDMHNASIACNQQLASRRRWLLVSATTIAALAAMAWLLG